MWCWLRDSNSRHPAYKAGVLPTELNQHIWHAPRELNSAQLDLESNLLALEHWRICLVGRVGFEPTKLEAEDLQSSGFNHSPICPYNCNLVAVAGIEPAFTSL